MTTPCITTYIPTGEVPNVAMLNRDGTIAFKTTLTASNLDRIRVTDAAATVDGGAVATATGQSRQANIIRRAVGQFGENHTAGHDVPIYVRNDLSRRRRHRLGLRLGLHV